MLLYNSTFNLKRKDQKNVPPSIHLPTAFSTAEPAGSEQYCHNFANWNLALGFLTISFPFAYWEIKEIHFTFESNSSDSVMVGKTAQ